LRWVFNIKLKPTPSDKKFSVIDKITKFIIPDTPLSVILEEKLSLDKPEVILPPMVDNPDSTTFTQAFSK